MTEFKPRIKQIISEFDRKPDGYGLPTELSISLDYDTDPDKVYPVLLYIPDIRQFEHHHISLNKKQARKLHKWLGKYLNVW